MKDTFFLPWHDEFNKSKDLSGKIQHSYKHNYFGIIRGQNVRWWNKPYFAITDESVVVKFFLDAVLSSKDDNEASVYISKDSLLELNDIKDIFQKMKNYKYANKLLEKNGDFSTVTISPCYDGKSRNSLIHVKMVYEPNRYGKWKIYKIEETEGSKLGRFGSLGVSL